MLETTTDGASTTLLAAKVLCGAAWLHDLPRLIGSAIGRRMARREKSMYAVIQIKTVRAY
jgi:hypothetical protein